MQIGGGKGVSALLHPCDCISIFVPVVLQAFGRRCSYCHSAAVSGRGWGRGGTGGVSSAKTVFLYDTARLTNLTGNN